MRNITLVAIDFAYHELTRRAIEISLPVIDPKEVVVISDQDLMPGSRWVPVNSMNSIAGVAELMLKWTWPLIDTDHAVFVQWDGMATRPDLWTDDFLNYDYIGAPWPWQPEGVNVGNGGFSLRSRKLLEVCGRDPAVRLTAEEPIAEDNIIGQHCRPYLEARHGMRFAPTELAAQFSYELEVYRESFGFHGLWNIVNNLSPADVDYFLSKLNYQGWNIYKWTHFLTALQNRGYIDHYNHAMEQLKKYNPEYVEV